MKLTPSLSRLSWAFIESSLLLAILCLSFSKSACETFTITALVIWILRKFPWDERFPRIPNCNWFYALFMFLVLGSLTQTPSDKMIGGIHGVLKWVEAFGLMFVCYELAQDSRKLHRLIQVFLFSMLLVTLNAFYQGITGFDFVKHRTADLPGRLPRLSSSLDSPNMLGIFYLFAIPLAAGFWFIEKRWTRKAFTYAALLVLFFVGFVLTMSRGPALALLIALTLFLLLFGYKKYLIALTTVVVALLVASPILFKNFVTSLNMSDITVGTRWGTWKAAWTLAMQHPFLGGGVNSYFWRWSEIFKPGMKAQLGYAHNCYLQMAVDTGFISVILFLIPFLLLLFLKRVKLDILSQALWIGVLAYVLHSFIDTNFYSYQPAFLIWLFWGAYVGRAYQIENKG